VHVDEDFAKFAVFIFTGAQIDLVSADGGLLGIPLAARRQRTTVATNDAFDDFFDDLFGNSGGLGSSRLIGVIVFLDQG
jgi:hypothetical protein